MNQSNQSKNIGQSDAMLRPPQAFAGDVNNGNMSNNGADEDMMGGEEYGMSDGDQQNLEKPAKKGSFAVAKPKPDFNDAYLKLVDKMVKTDDGHMDVTEDELAALQKKVSKRYALVIYTC